MSSHHLQSDSSGLDSVRDALFKIQKLSAFDFDAGVTVGTGTFGRVRLVKLRSCECTTPLAMKIMKKSEVLRLRQVEHVKAEKNILLAINHPFIVNLLACFQDSRRLYMVMEYVNGGELFNYLRKEQRLPNNHALFYTAEIVLAFQYLHERQIVYRDLKPENLLLDSKGHIKIADFGFAKIVHDRTWTLCGTPEYLAPEIIQSRGHNVSADWWALGILIYELLCGYPPFYDDNPFGIYQKILAGRIDYPSHLDQRSRHLIRGLLRFDRSRRYGCLKGGAEDVKRHKWFASVDWNEMLLKHVHPPFVPKTRGADDTSHYDQYPESEGQTPAISSEEQHLHFDDF